MGQRQKLGEEEVGLIYTIRETLLKMCWWTVTGAEKERMRHDPFQHTFNLDLCMTGMIATRATVDIRLNCSQAWEVGSEVTSGAPGRS